MVNACISAVGPPKTHGLLPERCAPKYTQQNPGSRHIVRGYLSTSRENFTYLTFSSCVLNLYSIVGKFADLDTFKGNMG
uniref:Uncharacterized protein n=1 Tax=Anguilla anguilla TaxID=7936 RepID=A0A0E9V0F2_ANGAN